MNKALITGGLGFLGYHLSARLLEEGYEVHVYDNGARGRIDAHIRSLLASNRYRLVLGDLLEEARLANLNEDYTHIFHLAAIVGVQNVVKRPYCVLSDNVRSLMNVLELARRQKDLRRFVFPSTSEVYAGTLEYFGMRMPTPEATPLTVASLSQPRTSYMLSKIYGEALCRHAGIPFTIIRPHNVYGPRMGMAHVIPELLERTHRALPGGTLLVYSPGHQRTFCYVDDAIELIVGVTTGQAGTNETFNIGSTGKETSMAALAEVIVNTVGKRLVIEAGPDTPGSPRRRRPDVSLAISVALYTPCVTLADGVRRTYDWYRKHAFAPFCAAKNGTIATRLQAKPCSEM